MHTLLQAAHDAAPPDARPAPPYHGGVDANPQLGRFGFAGVALFVADALSGLVATKDRAQFNQWMALADEVYLGHARAQGRLVKAGTKTQRRVLSKEGLAQLRHEVTLPEKVVGVRNGLPPALNAANTAVFAALDVELVLGGAYVTAGVRRAVQLAVQALPGPQVRAFLAGLDARLLREELRSMLVRSGDARAERVAACVWRTASGRARTGRASGGKVSHFIGRMDDGDDFIFVWKPGPRWNVLVAPRDEVLATVPDAHLRDAMAAVMAVSPPEDLRGGRPIQ